MQKNIFYERHNPNTHIIINNPYGFCTANRTRNRTTAGAGATYVSGRLVAVCPGRLPGPVDGEK